MYFTREKLIKIGMLTTIIVICIIIVSIILSGVNQFKLGSQLASVKQVTNLSHLLVRQQAKLFSLLLVKNAKNDELVEALDIFTKEQFVLDANLYSVSGNLMAKSQNALVFKQMLLTPSQQNSTQQIVEPIFSQEELVGFLRVTFDAQYGQTTRSKINDLFRQLYGELIILFLAGALLMGSIDYFFLKRRNLLINTISKSPTLSVKTQTQRFHSRRRTLPRK